MPRLRPIRIPCLALLAVLVACGGDVDAPAGKQAPSIDLPGAAGVEVVESPGVPVDEALDLATTTIPEETFPDPEPAPPWVPYDGQWPVPDSVERDGPEAGLLVQFGDIDNFGFGFAEGYDPFSGETSPSHRFPFEPSIDDAPGTDRIFVVSGYVDPEPADGSYVRRDGYTLQSARPGNQPFPLRLAFDTEGLEIQAAALQLFVDDFQPSRFGTRYHFRINGQELPEVAATINQLDQTGPVGKLLTVQLLPERLSLLAGGRIEIDIDDPTSNIGDGFAFDFVRLLLNPKAWTSAGSVHGRVTDRKSGAPLAGVLVSASNTRQASTGEDGRYLLEGVPAGLVVVSASHPDYLPAADSGDLASRGQLQVDLALDADQRTSASIGKRLDDEGRIDVYGIHFDTDRATLRPESEPVLGQVRDLLDARPGLSLVIAGHTDAEGEEAHNLDLSRRRAAAVVSWLVSQGVDPARLSAGGHGESSPVAGNDTPEGRALNRRVEIRDAKR